MGNVCKGIVGLIFIVGGILLLMYGLAMIGAVLSHSVAGIGLIVIGLIYWVHILGWCPMEKMEDK